MEVDGLHLCCFNLGYEGLSVCDSQPQSAVITTTRKVLGFVRH